MAVSLQHVAGVDVADREREKGKPDRQHEHVHHGKAPDRDCDKQSRGGGQLALMYIKFERNREVDAGGAWLDHGD